MPAPRRVGERAGRRGPHGARRAPGRDRPAAPSRARQPPHGPNGWGATGRAAPDPAIGRRRAAARAARSRMTPHGSGATRSRRRPRWSRQARRSASARPPRGGDGRRPPRRARPRRVPPRSVGLRSPSPRRGRPPGRPGRAAPSRAGPRPRRRHPGSGPRRSSRSALRRNAGSDGRSGMPQGSAHRPSSGCSPPGPCRNGDTAMRPRGECKHIAGSLLQTCTNGNGYSCFRTTRDGGRRRGRRTSGPARAGSAGQVGRRRRARQSRRWPGRVCAARITGSARRMGRHVPDGAAGAVPPAGQSRGRGRPPRVRSRRPSRDRRRGAARACRA